jgi:hypothetical protein
MSIHIEIVSDRRGLNAFVRLAADVYRNDPLWVPPLEREVRRTLNPAVNPYYRDATLRLFLAKRDGMPVARLAITISRAHAKRWEEHTAFFGFFESLPDREVSETLFAEAERYCADQGVTAIEGPFNPCHYSELGMLADSFDRAPSFFQTYNPPRYNELLTNLGYTVASRKFTARISDCRTNLQRRHGALERRTQMGDFTIRIFEMKQRKRDLEIMREVFNDAFSDNWHFLPSSKEEFEFAASMLKYVTDPGLILVLEHRGRPVGVTMFVYDINPLIKRMRGRVQPLQLLLYQRRKRRIRGIILYAGGIRKEFRGSRGYALMLHEAARIAMGFDTLECTWISEENDQARAAAANLEMIEDRHYIIYRKQVER